MAASEIQEDLSGDLQRFLLKETLSPTDLNELIALTRYIQFSPDEVILAEGSTNNRLFFLIEGTVSIVRAGETIAKLETPGDLLGEMSLITDKPCSASNISTTKTSLLVVEVTQLHKLSSRLQELFSNALNRLFSIILAKKLAITNEKATLFEITNRELQVAKKALEASSANRIDELTINQRTAFKKIKTLLQNETGSLRDRLMQLTESFDSDKSLRDKKVLLVEEDLDEQINAKMSLGGTGVDFTVVADMDSAKKALQESRFDIVCVNSSFVDLIPFARTLYPDAKYVFVTSEPVSKHFGALMKYPELSTIVARHPNDRSFTVKNISTTIRKLSSNDIFGMDKYLGWGTDVIELAITGSEQRHSLIPEIESYLDSIGIRGGLKSRGSRVAEELLMNAIYDAPTDKTGKSLYNHLTRENPVVLKPEECGKFRYACDGTFLAISVVDPFGALTRSTILSYLQNCFSDQISAPTPEGKGGGGNGLFQIIQSSSLTVFNVHPKVQTEVIALFNVNYQMQKISLHPSFHYFEIS